jgi:hypothetical protein
MSYRINKTDGELLVNLIDGRIDRDTADVALFGKNVTNFGELLNENFVKLTENFANSAPPPNPLRGQLWFDTSNNRMKVFDGISFKSSDTTVISNTQPNMTAGDLWIDSRNRQLYFSDGNATQLVGPLYTVSQGETGFKVETVFDTSGNSKVIAKLLIGNSLIAIFSKEEFTPNAIQVGFPGIIKKGINLSSLFTDFKFYGQSESASSITTLQGETLNIDNFYKINQNTTVTGSLYVKNNSGIRIGTNGNHTIQLLNNNIVAQNNVLNQNYSVRVTKNTGAVDAIFVNTANSRVGIFRNNPQYTLDVSGDLRVSGNLIVGGESVTLQVSNLNVENKTLFLAVSPTLLTDQELNDSGLIVKGIESDKSFIWKTATTSWTSSDNIELAADKSYRIGVEEVLSQTTLGESVTDAPGLLRIGKLETLEVDNVKIDESTITTTTPLVISSSGNISITGNRRITGIGTPTGNQDAANKLYVDNSFKNQPVALSIDVTGLNNTQMALVVQDLIPASTKNEGVLARVHTVIRSGSSTIRGLKQFKVISGIWSFDQDLVSSV